MSIRQESQEAPAARHDRRGHHCRGCDRGGRHPLQQVRRIPAGPLPVHLPAGDRSYLGVFTKGLPDSYAGVTAFTNATGAKPDVVMYYSGWYVPFPVRLRHHRSQ